MVLIVEEDRDLANNLQKSFAKRGFIAYAVNSFSATCDIVKKIFFYSICHFWIIKLLSCANATT